MDEYLNDDDYHYHRSDPYIIAFGVASIIIFCALMVLYLRAVGAEVNGHCTGKFVIVPF